MKLYWPFWLKFCICICIFGVENRKEECVYAPVKSPHPSLPTRLSSCIRWSDFNWKSKLIINPHLFQLLRIVTSAICKILANYNFSTVSISTVSPKLFTPFSWKIQLQPLESRFCFQTEELHLSLTSFFYFLQDATFPPFLAAGWDHIFSTWTAWKLIFF